MSTWQMVALGIGSGIAILAVVGAGVEAAVRLVWLWEDWR